MSGASEECRQPSGGVAMRVGRAFLVVLKIQFSINKKNTAVLTLLDFCAKTRLDYPLT